jgi:hypothetical protein
MMAADVVFALIICKVLSLPGMPLDVIPILGYFITYPKVSHLHAPRELPFDSVIGDADCGHIVTMNGSSWLGMAQFFEGESKNYAFFAVQE